MKEGNQHDVYAFIHLHVFVEYLLSIPVNHRDPRDAHPTRCVDHLTVQGRNVERFTRLGCAWRTGMRERVSLVQIHRIGFVKDVGSTGATVL